MQNIFVMWLRWHFYEVPQFLVQAWRNFLWFAAEFFSIPLLARTLFAPWRHVDAGFPRFFDLGQYAQAFIFGLYARLVGACIRLFLIACGIIFWVTLVVAGVVVIGGWLLVPFIALAGIVWSVL